MAGGLDLRAGDERQGGEGLVGQIGRERRRFAERDTPGASLDLSAVRVGDQDPQEELVALERGQRADRQGTAAAEPAQEGALGLDAGAARTVFDPGGQRDRLAVVGARLERERALAGISSSGSSRREIRSARPSRSRPDAARTRASSSPASSLRRRVSTLPRTSRSSRSGRSCSSWAARRAEPVPTRAPRGSASTGSRTRGKTSATSAVAGRISASRGSPRSGTAASRRPGSRTVGTSLRL